MCEGLPGNLHRRRVEWSEPVSDCCVDKECSRPRTVLEWGDQQVTGTSRLSVASDAQPRTASHDRCALTARRTRRARRDMSERRPGSASILPANDRQGFHVNAFTASSPVGRFDTHYPFRNGPPQSSAECLPQPVWVAGVCATSPLDLGQRPNSSNTRATVRDSPSRRQFSTRQPVGWHPILCCAG
jgi:hypothetical protein